MKTMLHEIENKKMMMKKKKRPEFGMWLSIERQSFRLVDFVDHFEEK
jgi:hypothetical protein